MTSVPVCTNSDAFVSKPTGQVPWEHPTVANSHHPLQTYYNKIVDGS